ncbi:hypothetical protein M231_00474 [Tremella mesenterica]|uniref:Uncharacterized protein n=1 Tax=Tremella mesenterica TaxID=5217 RepID=A0A4V1M4Z8_TREME|nr:hypothetical protein M231_00474 [Tremella mesenterica]
MDLPLSSDWDLIRQHMEEDMQEYYRQLKACKKQPDFSRPRNPQTSGQLQPSSSGPNTDPSLIVYTHGVEDIRGGSNISPSILGIDTSGGEKREGGNTITRPILPINISGTSENTSKRNTKPTTTNDGAVRKSGPSTSSSVHFDPVHSSTREGSATSGPRTSRPAASTADTQDLGPAPLTTPSLFSTHTHIQPSSQLPSLADGPRMATIWKAFGQVYHTLWKAGLGLPRNILPGQNMQDQYSKRSDDPNFLLMVLNDFKTVHDFYSSDCNGPHEAVTTARRETAMKLSCGGF